MGVLAGCRFSLPGALRLAAATDALCHRSLAVVSALAPWEPQLPAVSDRHRLAPFATARPGDAGGVRPGGVQCAAGVGAVWTWAAAGCHVRRYLAAGGQRSGARGAVDCWRQARSEHAAGVWHRVSPRIRVPTSWVSPTSRWGLARRTGGGFDHRAGIQVGSGRCPRLRAGGPTGVAVRRPRTAMRIDPPWRGWPRLAAVPAPGSVRRRR